MAVRPSSLSFDAGPRREEPAEIGSIGLWYGADVLARLLSRSHRLAAVIDLSDEHIGQTMFNAHVVDAEYALKDPRLVRVPWRAHREHAVPAGLRIE